MPAIYMYSECMAVPGSESAPWASEVSEVREVWNSRTQPQVKFLKFLKFVRSEVFEVLQTEGIEVCEVCEVSVRFVGRRGLYLYIRPEQEAGPRHRNFVFRNLSSRECCRKNIAFCRTPSCILSMDGVFPKVSFAAWLG
jgi:hypothetical protein